MINLVFEVPPGLGDITWCYTKIKSIIAPNRNISFKICSNPPFRGYDFVDLLPNITNAGYGSSYTSTLVQALPYDTDLSSLKSGTYPITMNPGLESGQHISTLFPAQKTHHHFRLNTTAAQEHKAQSYMLTAKRHDEDHPVIGFYCSSYAHRPDLGFWSPDEWLLFLKMIQDILPTATFIALGAKYDDRTFDVYSKAVQAGLNITSALGTADVGTTALLINKMDYFFAFPSGLGIIADVVQTPCMMWYWSNLVPKNANFLNSYADLDNIKSGFHINLPYIKVLSSVDAFVDSGLKHIIL